MDVDGNIVSYELRDEEWSEGCMRDVRLMCPKCGGQLDRECQDGKWIAQNPISSIAGYHISMMCSMINSVAGMWTRFQLALNDPSRMQQFFNSDLGLPFVASGNKVTETLLDRCADEDLNFVIGENECHIPSDADEGPCSMGIDVGGHLDVRISRVREGRRTAVYVGKVKYLDELYDLMTRYNVERAIMDSMPETTLAQDFQETSAMMGIDVWLCRYGSEGADRRRSYDPISRVVTVDRTIALDRSFSQLRSKRNVLPANFRSIFKGGYVTEMCNPVRQLEEDKKGNAKYVWTKGRDHQRHCDTYDMIAADMMTAAVIGEVYVE